MKMTKTLWAAAAVATASLMASAAPAAAEVDYTFLSKGTNFIVDADTFVTAKTTFSSPELTCLKGACSTVTFLPTMMFDEIILSNNAVYKFAPNAFTTAPFSGFSATSSAQFSTLEVSAAPEPETWALMIVGVGLAGGMMRYGRRAGASLTAA